MLPCLPGSEPTLLVLPLVFTPTAHISLLLSCRPEGTSVLSLPFPAVTVLIQDSASAISTAPKQIQLALLSHVWHGPWGKKWGNTGWTKRWKNKVDFLLLCFPTWFPETYCSKKIEWACLPLSFNFQFQRDSSGNIYHGFVNKINKTVLLPQCPTSYFLCDNVSVNLVHDTDLPLALQSPVSFSLSLPLAPPPSSLSSDATLFTKPFLTTRFNIWSAQHPSSVLSRLGTLNLLCLALLFLFFFPSASFPQQYLLLISHKFKLLTWSTVFYLSLPDLALRI